MSNSQNVVICMMPQESFDLISETLAADARSKAFDRSLREEIGEAHRALVSGMTALTVPVEALPNMLLTDAYTGVYMSLLAGVVNEGVLEWKPEAVEAIKRSAVEAFRSYYGFAVPQTTRDMFLFQLSSVKSEEDLKSKGFVLKGPVTSWDVYEGVSEWENEDGIVVLTANFNGLFFYLGEKTMELLRDIVNDNRLGRLLREADIVIPAGNNDDGIHGYVWMPYADETKQLLTENPQFHVYNVLNDSGNYRIIPGMQRPEGCIEIGYIIAQKRVDLGGSDGILIRLDSSYPLQTDVNTRR